MAGPRARQEGWAALPRRHERRLAVRETGGDGETARRFPFGLVGLARSVNTSVL